MNTIMTYEDKKEIINRLAKYFEAYKGPYYYPRNSEFSEAEELSMFYESWIHEPKSFQKVLEMLQLFESGEPEEASRLFNEYTGKDKTDSILKFYSFIKDYYL